ncbi:MAG: hypothetical protein AMXMBFR34_31620 [Myxococcaceae bacterium]
MEPLQPRRPSGAVRGGRGGRSPGWLALGLLALGMACGVSGEGLGAGPPAGLDAGWGGAGAGFSEAGEGSGAPADSDGGRDFDGGRGADAGQEADAGEGGPLDSGAGLWGDAGARWCGGPFGGEVTLMHQGRSRRALLYVPASAAGHPAPLVVSLHGFSSGPEEHRDTTHYRELAQARGFLVAFPSGVAHSWNGGAGCGPANVTGVDDVGFLRALIAQVSAPPPRRVGCGPQPRGGWRSAAVAFSEGRRRPGGRFRCATAAAPARRPGTAPRP